MEDLQIVKLFWQRAETAITETDKKYGRYCHSIAYHILYDDEDSKECVNDTYLKIWESIPPHRPDPLSAFIGKITRNLALNRYRYRHAQLRGSGQVPLVLDELHECIPDPKTTDKMITDLLLTEIFNRFLSGLSQENRIIFMQRYWYFTPVRQIAKDLSVTESKVKMSLHRSRKKLKEQLEKEGVTL